MSRLISIVGNLGAGKTTLARQLCALSSTIPCAGAGGFTPYWESPEARPFQRAFTAEPPRWALANQLDFFLFRCQQESLARQRPEIAVFDGGLDQDYHVFTRHIFNRGYLSPDELSLCQRFYTLARGMLPPPDLIIYLTVDIPTLLARRAARARPTVDASFDSQQFVALQRLLDDWLNDQTASPVLRLADQPDLQSNPQALQALVAQVTSSLSGGS